MFSEISAEVNSLRAALAPFIRASISIPAAAIGRRPTAVNTEKRPPTLSGTTNVSQSLATASTLTAPLALSVVA